MNVSPSGGIGKQEFPRIQPLRERKYHKVQNYPSYKSKQVRKEKINCIKNSFLKTSTNEFYSIVLM